MNAIGAFFIQLGHLIEEIIEALSVLFQFGHIIDTQHLLLAELTNRIQGVAGNPAYPGLATILKNSVSTPINNFFSNSEQTVTSALNSMANALGSSSPAAFPGGGSTVHSAFTATPKSGGASSSTATQGTWGMQKFNAGTGSGSSAASPASPASLQDATDPNAAVATAFTTFFNDITGNGTLSSQWSQVQSGAQALTNASSAADFIKQGLAELLKIVALLVDGVLAVANSLVRALFSVIDDLITLMFGLVTTTI